MQPILRMHDAITRSGYQLAALLVIAIACSYGFEVVARYFFNAPTQWASAIVSYLLCATIFLAMPEQTRRRAHIAITTLVDSAPPPRRRQYSIMIAVVAAAVCFFASWVTAAETWTQFQDGVLTIDAYETPKWRVSIFIAYGLLSSALYFLREAFELDTHPTLEDARA